MNRVGPAPLSVLAVALAGTLLSPGCAAKRLEKRVHERYARVDVPEGFDEIEVQGSRVRWTGCVLYGRDFPPYGSLLSYRDDFRAEIEGSRHWL